MLLSLGLLLKLCRLVAVLLLLLLPWAESLECPAQCGAIPIRYPFGTNDGCGAPQFRKMLTCNATDLYFVTPNGNYKVQSIDYDKGTMAVYDPDMSTCAILQPHHDLVMTDIQYAVIPPSPDTVFALMNCSLDSPVLNHYRSLCFNFSGHSCDELYSCNSFKTFQMGSNATASIIPSTAAPPCCFTGYSTMKFMSMDILDCTHFTTVYNTEDLKGVGPMDWTYGLKFSFSVPDSGCDRCSHSGGTCGFDTETGGLLCLCSSTTNSTRECAAGTGSFMNAGVRGNPWKILQAFALTFKLLLHFLWWSIELGSYLKYFFQHFVVNVTGRDKLLFEREHLSKVISYWEK